MIAKPTILALTSAFLLTVSPLALASARESLVREDGTGAPNPTAAPALMQLAQDMEGGEEQPRRKKRQQTEQGGGAGGGGEQQPRRRRDQAEQGGGGGEGGEQQPRRRRNQAEQGGGGGEGGEQQPRRRRDQAEQGGGGGEGAEQQPRRRRDQAAPVLQDEQQPRQADDQQPRRRRQQQAEPQDVTPQGGAEDGQPRRRRQQAEPSPDTQEGTQPRQADEGQPRRNRQQQAEPQPGVEGGDGQSDQADDRRRRRQGDDSAGGQGGADQNGAVQGDSRNARDMSDDDLNEQMKSARDALRGDRGRKLSASERARLEESLSTSRGELLRRRKGGEAGAKPRLGEAGGGQDGNAVVNLPRGGEPNPVVEKRRVSAQSDTRAGSLLGDETPADKLDDAALRRRLSSYRGALASGDISPERERELRRRLATDREALRGRVSIEEEQSGGRRRAAKLPFDDRPVVVRPPTREEERTILSDRRRSRELDEVALNRRMRVYRQMIQDERTSAAEREAYVRYLEDDRAELRGRLVNERRNRAERWREVRDNRDYYVDVDVDIYESGPREVTIWAAEVDDEAIEEQLVARPMAPVGRYYTREQILNEPEVVMAQPEVRRSVPSVELDTIHFGFNEAFVAEEEIANLERVGKIIEKIVASHPDEVFMIEGHTDAVGDDAYNVELSKKRAEAVKQALTEYYVIAPENLATVGLGERYLKIPTGDEEAENRRVTLRRVTSLVQK